MHLRLQRYVQHNLVVEICSRKLLLAFQRTENILEEFPLPACQISIYHNSTKQHDFQDFIRKHGHSNVPQKYESNPSLGAWVARQRLIMRQWEDDQKNTQHATDEKSLLIGERVERLKNIGLEPSIGKCDNSSIAASGCTCISHVFY